MKRALVVVFISMFPLMTYVARAQEAAKQDAEKSAEPKVTETVRKMVIALQLRAQGLEDAKSVLQREEDSVLAELQRQLAVAQQACGAGYDLSSTLTCVKKK